MTLVEYGASCFDADVNGVYEWVSLRRRELA